MSLPAELVDQVAELLVSAGIGTHGLTVEPHSRGGNNRVYRVSASGSRYIVKQYFRHADDTRDRLGAEYAFLSHAARAAPGWCPLPLACDPGANLALHEFIDGRALRQTEIGVAEVDAAITFLQAINVPEFRHNAQLPVAADACFSIGEHLALVENRVAHLAEAMREESSTAAVARRLNACWQRIQAGILASTSANHVTEAISPASRIVSPSDFGFHNALRVQDGRIRFIDFEYAGWDDPAKTAGDFFHQLALPVPAALFERFAAALLLDGADTAGELARITLMRPVYGMKWCCIALNIFHPVHLARRRFADPAIDEQTLKLKQLTKAIQLLDDLENSI